MAKPWIVTVIGSFPPPIHGASVINQSLFELFQAQGLNASKIDLSPGQTQWWGYHLTRVVRVIAGFFTIIFTPSDTSHRYVMSVDGGAGLFYNAMLALAVRMRKQRLLLYHHSSNYVWADSMLMRLLLKVSGKDVGHIMCSAQMFSKFRKRYGVSAPGFVVNNAAWVPSQHSLSSTHAGPIRLGHLSGLTDEKGLGRAIETLRELRRRGVAAELTLAGPAQDGAAQQSISHAQKEFGNLLHWVGVAKGKNKILFYEGIDYFLFPSLYRHETQSLVVPEALAGGVPVIAHNHRYVGEVVGHGGLLIPVESPFAPEAADWIVSGHLHERRVAARQQFEELRQDVSSQLDILLDWASGEAPNRPVQSVAPKVTVVTVNLNMARELAGTLDSVLGQDYPNLEAVVIDGGSTDGSREIITRYGPRLGYWASERDRNLYDGMNKGVAAATGEWVLFMNAGDRFAAPDVLSCVFAVPHQAADILYGHHIRSYVERGIARELPAEQPDVLPRRMFCSHQAMLMRRRLLVERPFALDLLIADYDAILAAYLSGKRFEAVDCIIAVTAQGGRSDTARFRALRERMMLVRRSGLMTSRIWLYYARLYVRTVIALSLKKILPRGLVSAILRHRPIGGMG